MDQIDIIPDNQTEDTVGLEFEEESMLWEYIRYACTGGEKAKIIFIAITSRVEGKKKSKGLPYGQGKSLFAAILAAQIYEYFDSILGIEPFKTVKENFGYTWEQHIESVTNSNNRRKLAYILDDLQRIAGKSKSRDPYVQSWAEFFTTARPFFGVIIITCPSIGELAKCFRELINFEIKIPEEGEYEVQFLKDYSDFSRPLEPLKSMKYKGEGIIPRAPKWFVDWYRVWRKEESFDEFVAKIKNKDKHKKEKRQSIDDEWKALRDKGLTNATRDEYRKAVAKPPLIQGVEGAAA